MPIVWHSACQQKACSGDSLSPARDFVCPRSDLFLRLVKMFI